MDLSILKSNSDLQTLMDTISYNIGKSSRYILVFEDADRSQLFYDWRYDHNNPPITKSCFLNMLGT